MVFLTAYLCFRAFLKSSGVSRIATTKSSAWLKMSSNERLTLNYFRLNVGIPVLDSCRALFFLKPTIEIERQCSEVDAVCL